MRVRSFYIISDLLVSDSLNWACIATGSLIITAPGYTMLSCMASARMRRETHHLITDATEPHEQIKIPVSRV